MLNLRLESSASESPYVYCKPYEALPTKLGANERDTENR